MTTADTPATDVTSACVAGESADVSPATHVATAAVATALGPHWHSQQERERRKDG